MRVHAQDQKQSRTSVPSGAARQASPAAEHTARPLRDERASQENASSEGTAGNPAAVRWIQRKPVLNWPGDRFEREADDVADRVIRMSEPPSGGIAATPLPPGGAVQTSSPASAAQPDTQAAERVAGQGGAPLSDELRSYFEPRFGHDFSGVRVHADAEAADAARSIDAHAYTIGSDIVFGAGRYAPDAQEGKRLLAHELTHVVQQGGAGKAAIQRNAIASWADIKPEEKIHFLSQKDQGKYLKQQERIKNNKEVKDPISLPEVEKMLEISANYHHYDKYPTPEGGTLEFDSAIADEAKRQYRVNGTPDFWPNIKWKTKSGEIREIGVRFKISFVSHAWGAESKAQDNYTGGSLYEARTKPEDNVFLVRDIDRLSRQGLNVSSIIGIAESVGIKNFTLDSEKEIVTYKPTGGGDAKEYRMTDDALIIIKLVREEARTQKLEKKLENTVLGTGSESTVTLDTNKSAPAEKTYNAYERMPGIQDYKPYEEDALKKTKTRKFTPEERIKRAGAVVAHEIGHNIGMGHTDFGIMNETAENDMYVQTATTLKDPTEISSGSSYSFVNRIYEIRLESTSDVMTPENVQLLANRMQSITQFMLTPPKEGERNPTAGDYWDENITGLRPLLEAGDFKTIFANDRYATMLAVPYQETLQDELIGKGNLIVDKNNNDKAVIRSAMSAEGRLHYAGWEKLSAQAKSFIKTETLRLMGVSFSGVTYFSSQEEGQKY